MKKSFMMTVGILAVMLTLGGMAYGQGASSPGQGSGQSVQQGGSSGSSGQAMTHGLEKISVNIANAQELQRVPGLDQTTAQNIIDYRDANGPFRSVDDLTKVQGIDNKQKLDPLRKHLTAKLDLNVTSSDQLQRVPGIHQSLAQNIIRYREANGPFTSVDDLSRIQGIDNFKLDMIKKYVQVGGKE
jgi:competence ComEA-like helix-hairpin-helix protein